MLLQALVVVLHVIASMALVIAICSKHTLMYVLVYLCVLQLFCKTRELVRNSLFEV